MWAFADQGNYKMTLRKTLKDIEQCQATASELQAIVENKFSDERLYDEFCNAVLKSDPVEQLIDLEELL